jgi:hypothetical protein
MTRSIRGLMGSKRNLVFGVALGLLIAGTGNPAIAAEQSGTSPEGAAGLQAVSWLASVPYGAVKVAYALGGGIVMSGGDTEAAKAVWVPSMTGDYIVQPENLTGDKPLHFMGGSSEKSQPELFTRR